MLVAVVTSAAHADMLEMMYGPSAVLVPGATPFTAVNGSYLSTANSPFYTANLNNTLGYWEFEDFEDVPAHALNATIQPLLGLAGVTASGVWQSNASTTDDILTNTQGSSFSSFTDSVDGDDGSIGEVDPVSVGGANSGSGGDAYFFSLGEDGDEAGIRFTFTALPGRSLPTYVGLAWTDGSSFVEFAVYGAGNVFLGSLGPATDDDPQFPDGQFNGTTAEDRFFGAYNMEGIESIVIIQSGAGIEVDHLQFGGNLVTDPEVPEPASLALLATGAAGLLFGRRFRRSRRVSAAA